MRGRRARIAALVALGAAVLAGAASALVPDDPGATHWSYGALNLPRAWDLTTGSPRVVIAVVDSGVQEDHPELAGAAIPGYDFVEDRPGATPVDGHGTAVAGAAAARGGNAIGGVGSCPECAILPLQVVGRDGIARNTDIAEAIDYAVDRGAAVVNISLIGPNSPQRLRDSIIRARAAGVLVVAAAGNEGNEIRMYPAAFDEATSVAAMTPTGELARYSSRGPWVDFAAPECTPVPVLGGGTGIGCATSVSAPLISGIVGLMRTQAPSAYVVDIESALVRTALERRVEGTKTGIPDAEAALRLLGSTERDIEPVILGEPVVGRVLEAFTQIWAGAGLSVEYQWERCLRGNCSSIAGATGPRLALTRADSGHRVRVGVSLNGVTTTSLQTAAVAMAPRNVDPPSIVGRSRVGARLLARLGAWEGTTLRYSVLWFRCRGQSCASDGRGATYRVRPADRGSRLRVEVTATNAVGLASARSKSSNVVR
jgi:thermitase